jgi:hypothetical protein
MKPELATFAAQLDVLVAFVEGRLDGSSLDAALATDEMRVLLNSFEDSRSPAITNHFRRLHNNQDRTSLGGLVNSEGIIEDFLNKAEVSFTAARRFSNMYRLLLSSLPNYLDPPMDFLVEHVIPAEEGLSDATKNKIIKERLKAQFRFVSKPPSWIQDPEWPIRNGKPLVFLDQIAIDAPELFHDGGAAFLFYDTTDGSFETVAQFY